MWATRLAGVAVLVAIFAAMLAISGYFWSRARHLANDEAVTFAKGSQRFEQIRFVSYRLSALFLLAMTIFLLVKVATSLS